MRSVLTVAGVTGLLTCLLAAPATAAPLGDGQTAGGGNLGTRSGLDKRDVILSFEGLGGERLRVRSLANAYCPRIDGFVGDVLSTRHAAGGGTAIRVDRTIRRAFDGRRFTLRYAIRGTVEDAAGSGTFRLRATMRTRTGRSVGCDTGTLPWQVRSASPSGDLSAARPPGGTRSHGLVEGGRLPISLRASADGTRLLRSAWSVRVRCREAGAYNEFNVTPPADLRPDGSFGASERFSFNDGDERLSFRTRFRGRFDATGAAAGIVRMQLTVFDRRTGRRIDTCDSGTRDWTTRP